MTSKYYLKAILAASTVLVAPSITHATDDIVEEIIIAGRRAQPINEIAKSVSVLSEDTLVERQHTFLLDALQTLPGVSINQTGAFGGVATVTLRGNSTDQTVVLIDGVQVNDPSGVGGGFNFASLDPNGIERVEVLRGPQAVLYGSDAIGGVINVITKSGEGGFGGDVFAEYGAFDSIRAGGNVKGGTRSLNFNLSGTYVNSEGISAAEVRDGNPETDGYKATTLRGKVRGAISDNLSIEVVSNYTDTESEFDGFALQADGSFGLGDTDDVSETEEFSIAGRALFDVFNDALNSTLSIEYSSIDRANFNAGVFSFGAEGERLNLDYLAIATLNKNWTLTSGLQYENIKAETVDPQDISTKSVFGILSYNSENGLVVSGGARVDDHETFGSTTNGEANIAYTLKGTGTRLTAAWSEGFKAPTLFQLTFACCGFAANPDLSPERSNAWEAGFTQPFADGKATLGATYFDQRTDDLIIFTFAGGYQNIARARGRGVELTFDAAITDTLQLQANYTHTSSRDRDTDTQLIRRPKNQAFAALNWQATERFSTNISMTFNGEELDTGGTVDSWTRFDVRASYDLTENVELFGRLDNLFDANYQQVLGYGTPGISAFGGIRARF